MIITISGPPGSGTSTLARSLSDRLKMRWVNSGDLFRKIASDRGISLKELGRIAEKGPDVDYLIDDCQRDIARQGSGIFEGRLSGHILNADLRIMLKADIQIRAGRIARRENKLLQDALDESRVREECEARRYKMYYNIDIHSLGPYDLVIDTGRWSESETLAIVLAAVSALQRRTG